MSNRSSTSAAIVAKPTWHLPAVIMALAGLVYFLTLNYRANLWSEGLATRACGWQWLPILQEPLVFLFQLPFHLLPEDWRPVALNLGNMLLAMMVLGLLVRCMMLWPNDRTPDMRHWQEGTLYFIPVGGLSWFAPVVAALGLGLTLNFWEHATAASGEMINVLVVAVVIWCLLEFRLDLKSKWLWWAAVVYGLGMANDWALITLFPCLVLALASMHGWKALVVQMARTLSPFFNRKKPAFQPNTPRIRRPSWHSLWLILGGLATGGALYFLLPLLSFANGIAPLWQCLKVVIHAQKVGILNQERLLLSDGRGVLLAFSSLVPLFVISIRWRDEATPDHVRITDFVLRSIYGFVAVVCAGVLLGAAIGPAELAKQQPFLIHYFLCALSLGCCVNYFIRLLLGRRAVLYRRRRMGMDRTLRVAGLAGLLLLLVGGVTVMAWRNLPLIWLANRTLPADFQKWVLADLPVGPKVVVADDASLLHLSRLFLLGTPAGQDTIFIDTSSALWADYHRPQQAAYPQQWQEGLKKSPPRSRLQPAQLDRLLMDLAADGRKVFYLEPSVMNPLDQFQMHSGDFHYAMSMHSTNATAITNFPAEKFDFNDADWSEFEGRLLPRLTNAIESFLATADSQQESKLARLLRLPPGRNMTAVFFAQYFSRAEDERAVELQAAGRWAEAATELTNALNLNPNNVVARVNLDFNLKHQLSQGADTNNEAANASDFGNFRALEPAVAACGPYDEPYHRVMVGAACAKAKEPYHAMDQFSRVLKLQPFNWGAMLWLARLNLAVGQPAVTLQMVAEARHFLQASGHLTPYQVNLDMIEAQADLSLKHKTDAMAAMDQAIADAHEDPRLVAEAVQALWRAGMKDEARELLDQLQQEHPDMVSTYVLRGMVYFELGELEQADTDLSHALKLDPNNMLARFRRGYVYLQQQQYDAAQKDFETMLTLSTNAFQAHYALAQVAHAKNDLNTAKQELEAYLGVAPTDATDYTNAVSQLKDMP